MRADPKILVVDDSTADEPGERSGAHACDALLRLVTEAGFDAERASAEEAPGRLRAAAFDVLLVDDGATGALALVESLRAADERPAVAVVTSGDDRELARAYESGADDVLRRPLSRVEVLARLRTVARGGSALEAAHGAGREAQALFELTQTLAASLDFRDILYTVVRRIAEVVAVDRASVVLAPERADSDVAYVVAASDDQQLSNLQIQLSKYPEIQEVLRTKEPLTIRDAATHPVLDGVRDDVRHVGLGTMTLLPMVWEGSALGVLFLRARVERGALDSVELGYCKLVARATAVALRNARMVQSLREHSRQSVHARIEAEQRVGSLKRYADLFMASADGIAVFGRDGRLLFANPSAFAITRTTPMDEAALGRFKMAELLHPDDLPLAIRTWEQISAGEYPRELDLRIRAIDGGSVVCSCSFAPLPDSGGSVLVSFRDVTEHRRTASELLKTKEFLESLIEASVDAIVAADMKGTIILFNEGAERIYGYTAADVVGRMNVRALYPDDGARNIMRMLIAPHHGGEGRLDNVRTEGIDAKGEIVPISLSAAVIYDDGKPAATFGIFTDLRERLRVEERLAQAQQKLAVTEKQALIAELAGTAAHELNQPLTSVMGYAELLKRKLGRDTAEHRAADVIVREAERMADIVRKIGKITKYETKSYVGQQRILDLDKATEREDPTQKR